MKYFIFHTNIKKRRATVPMLVFRFGYRQVTCISTNDRTVHAYERELSICLSSICEYWRYSNGREQELKAQYPKSIERKRLVDIMRLKHLKISLLLRVYSWNSKLLAFHSCVSICFLLNQF